MGKRNSFVFHSSWGDLVKGLPNETAGELVKMIIAYAFEGEEIRSDDPTLNAVFGMVKIKLDEDGSKYQAKVERMKSNAEKSRNDIDTKSARNRNDIESDTDTVTVTVTDTVTDTKSPTETKERVKREKTSLTQDQMQSMLLESALSCQTQDKLREWIQYKQARREPYKEMGFKSLISQVYKHEREAGIEAVCDLIDLCMSNEWKGIIWDKLPREIPQRAAPGGKIDWANI